MSVARDWEKQQDKTTVEEKLAIAIAENVRLRNRLLDCEVALSFYAGCFNTSQKHYLRQGKLVKNPRSILYEDGGDRAWKYFNSQQDL